MRYADPFGKQPHPLERDFHKKSRLSKEDKIAAYGRDMRRRQRENLIRINEEIRRVNQSEMVPQTVNFDRNINARDSFNRVIEKLASVSGMPVNRIRDAVDDVNRPVDSIQHIYGGSFGGGKHFLMQQEIEKARLRGEHVTVFSPKGNYCPLPYPYKKEK